MNELGMDLSTILDKLSCGPNMENFNQNTWLKEVKESIDLAKKNGKTGIKVIFVQKYYNGPWLGPDYDQKENVPRCFFEWWNRKKRIINEVQTLDKKRVEKRMVALMYGFLDKFLKIWNEHSNIDVDLVVIKSTERTYSTIWKYIGLQFSWKVCQDSSFDELMDDKTQVFEIKRQRNEEVASSQSSVSPKRVKINEHAQPEEQFE